VPPSSVRNLEIFHHASSLTQGAGGPRASRPPGAHRSPCSKKELPGKGLAGFMASQEGAVGGCSLILWAAFLLCRNMQLLPPSAGCCSHPLVEPNGAERTQLGLARLQLRWLCPGTGTCTTELQPGGCKGTRWPQERTLLRASASSSSRCQPTQLLGGTQAWGELQEHSPAPNPFSDFTMGHYNI